MYFCILHFVFHCRELMDNKVFFQHPDLMRALCVHETVMQLMVNTLNKSQQQQQAAASEQSAGNRQSIAGAPNIDTVAQQSKVSCKVSIYVSVLFPKNRNSSKL